MQIHGPSRIHGPQPMNPPHRNHAAQRSSPGDRVFPSDQLDISQEASMISRMRELPNIRAERVAAIRAEIAAGTYETAHKMEIAVGRLLDELAG